MSDNIKNRFTGPMQQAAFAVGDDLKPGVVINHKQTAQAYRDFCARRGFPVGFMSRRRREELKKKAL